MTIKTWDRTAETAAQHLTRGRRVAVQGRLAHTEWTDPDGRRAERLTVVADRVEFLDPPSGTRRGRRHEGPDEVGEHETMASGDRTGRHEA